MAGACRRERMPGKTRSVMEEKLRFVFEFELGEHTVTELCQRYEIARATGYVWLRRYRQFGVAGLVERSRAAHRRRNQTPEEMEQMVLELRQAHMRWGPRKLKRVRTAPYTEPLAHADGANRVWCADFKGWFRTADGERIDPLTISDAHSRYLLRCQAVEKMDTARVRAIFEAAFREYGMPEAIRTDNGAPFASPAVAGLSRLAVWWIKLDIVPERIAAGHPEQNGRHERMHRTLKQETADPPAANRRKQQRALDRFRREYNEVRPHEALGMRTPAEVYEPSARKYPEQVPAPEYPANMLVRSVRRQGHFRWKQDEVFLSEVLWGERVGLLQENDRWFTVYFAQHPIALFDSQQLRVAPLLTNSKLGEGEGDASPSPSPSPLVKRDQKVSDMRPV